MKKIFIIAEIGCNHNGDKILATEMIKQAYECGVDAVKFQTFKADKLITKYAPKADYQILTTGDADSQLEMTKKLELPWKTFLELKNYAESLGLIVFSTPFDLEAIELLASIAQSIWKIPSGEITNLPYLEKIGSLKCSNKHIILSTGMATIQEIHKCINILEKSGTSRNLITILHCNTEYPTPDKDVNISAILDLHKNFPDMNIGFSDHSIGSVAAIGAAALGITMIEKHFTLNKDFKGPDHKASATPKELRELVTNIRRIEEIWGYDKKIVTKSEQKNKIIARKSIVACCQIKKGETFTKENITCKRPGNGISPMHWYEILGKTSEKDFEEDELITFTGFIQNE
ncbi:MAG: N-acetylneuraminate synthase [Peptoanaerobacter stomatis]|uniref:N-acetylneuraminate synthase n=1 Tax=Peptoanaerobacter stomatis TaxID=796937 RepID=UPI003F9FEF16